MEPRVDVRGTAVCVDLGCCLDLKFIARRMWNVQYKPQVIREPKATATIFRTGKIICLGTKSVEESRLAARKFVRKLQKFGFPVHFLNFKIQNIMLTDGTCFQILLNMNPIFFGPRDDALKNFKVVQHMM
uniref:Uncharacterized protein n=1 Tax=Astatotilapia calliptera TaxID=8154 RepID=A0A3P8QAA5_ASTCA